MLYYNNTKAVLGAVILIFEDYKSHGTRTYCAQEFNYYSFHYSKCIPMLLPTVLFLQNFYFVINNDLSTMNSYDYSGWLMDTFRFNNSQHYPSSP